MLGKVCRVIPFLLIHYDSVVIACKITNLVVGRRSTLYKWNMLLNTLIYFILGSLKIKSERK